MVTRLQAFEAAAVAALGVIVAIDLSRDSSVRRAQTRLEQAASEIDPPAPAHLEAESRLAKAQAVRLSKLYRGPDSKLDASIVLSHYRAKLTQNGWADCSGEAVTYCKEAMRATIQIDRLIAGNLEFSVQLSIQP